MTLSTPTDTLTTPVFIIAVIIIEILQSLEIILDWTKNMLFSIAYGKVVQGYAILSICLSNLKLMTSDFYINDNKWCSQSFEKENRWSTVFKELVPELRSIKLKNIDFYSDICCDRYSDRKIYASDKHNSNPSAPKVEKRYSFCH